MKEKVVSNLRMPRMPLCAKIEKVISSPKYGDVAAIVTCNGNELTFFRTDFLDFTRVAWYPAEIFSEDHYHEEIPKKIVESIRENGFFLSKHFLTTIPNGDVKSCEGRPIQNLMYKHAKELACSLEVPELESDLMYGIIYDLLGKWLIETGTLTKDEWLYGPTSKSEQKILLEKDRGGWTVKELLCTIFSMEWTQEKYEDFAVVRAGEPYFNGDADYPARMRYTYDKGFEHPTAKVRAFLYFK